MTTAAPRKPTSATIIRKRVTRIRPPRINSPRRLLRVELLDSNIHPGSLRTQRAHLPTADNFCLEVLPGGSKMRTMRQAVQTHSGGANENRTSDFIYPGLRCRL